MNLPGYTAQASLYERGKNYPTTATGTPIQPVLPQAILSEHGSEGMFLRRWRVVCEALDPDECRIIGIPAPWGCMLCQRYPRLAD